MKNEELYERAKSLFSRVSSLINSSSAGNVHPALLRAFEINWPSEDDEVIVLQAKVLFLSLVARANGDVPVEMMVEVEANVFTKEEIKELEEGVTDDND